MVEQDAGRRAHRKFAASSAIETGLSQINDPKQGARLVRAFLRITDPDGSPGDRSHGREDWVSCSRGLLGGRVRACRRFASRPRGATRRRSSLCPRHARSGSPPASLLDMAAGRNRSHAQATLRAKRRERSDAGLRPECANTGHSPPSGKASNRSGSLRSVRGGALRYDRSVETSWSVTFGRVRQRNPKR